MIKIRTFRAIDDLESCQKFVEGHMRVLKVFGITMITSANIEWFLDPNTYVIIAESIDSTKIYGGARIQVSSKDNLLPIETAISDMDYKIHSIVADLRELGTGELCGLWNSREVAGFGLGSIYLGRVGVAIASMLELNTLFALCAPQTVANCIKVGFSIEKSIGQNGTFYYPKEDLIATAVFMPDVSTLSMADEIERINIFSLREHPTQNKTELGIKNSFEVIYDINISRNGKIV